MTLTPAIAIDHETHLQLLIDDTPRKTQRTGVTIYVLTITIRETKSRFIVQKEELRTLTSVQSQCTKLLDDLHKIFVYFPALNEWVVQVTFSVEAFQCAKKR